MLFTQRKWAQWNHLLWWYTGYDHNTLHQFKRLIAYLGSKCCLLEDLNNLGDMTVYFGLPLSVSIHAWQLGQGNLCLASLNRFPLMRLIEWPFIHRGLLMCHSSNVNHPSYFGKLTEPHSPLALWLCALLKPGLCVSSHFLIRWEMRGVPVDPVSAVLSFLLFQC